MKCCSFFLVSSCLSLKNPLNLRWMPRMCRKGVNNIRFAVAGYPEHGRQVAPDHLPTRLWWDVTAFFPVNFLGSNFPLFLQLKPGSSEYRRHSIPGYIYSRCFVIESCWLSGSVFQWIEFQIPILKMQVRFLPGLQQNNQKKSKPLNLNGLAVFVFRAYPFCSSEVKCVVRDSGDFGKRKFSLPRSGLTHSLSRCPFNEHLDWK